MSKPFLCVNVYHNRLAQQQAHSLFPAWLLLLALFTLLLIVAFPPVAPKSIFKYEFIRVTSAIFNNSVAVIKYVSNIPRQSDSIL